MKNSDEYDRWKILKKTSLIDNNNDNENVSLL